MKSAGVRSLPYLLCLFTLTGNLLHAAPKPSELGVAGGFVVHVGGGTAEESAALREHDGFLVQRLVRDASKVAGERDRLRAAGQYGQVLVDHWEGGGLPYIDNLVNLLILEEGAGVSREEALRVLTPNGRVATKKGGSWTTETKPRSSKLDEWTHYFHGAEGNAVSKDTVVAPPNRLQWVGGPKWSRHHDRMASMSAMVTAGGRVFYIMDQGSRISILLPSKWQLLARDAFNGVPLWSRDIPEWHSQMWPLKSGPTQLARRLVSDGESVFATLALHAPVSRLDAATGKTLKEYAGTEGTEEIVHVDGVLYLLVNPGAWALKDFAPKLNTGDQKRVQQEFEWDGKPRVLKAIEADTGKELWATQGVIAPLTLVADASKVLYYDGDGLKCVESRTGKQRWLAEGVKRRKVFEYNYAPRIVIHEGVVLYAGGDGEMKSFDAKDGRELWAANHDRSGYRSPEDLLVAGGLVWSAPTTSGNMSGEFTGRDPVTGKVVKQFPPTVDTYWFHHRCYIAKATERYLMPSRTGIEFVDFNEEKWDINHWVRGGCLYGVMPANGLTYAPPHNCACYPEAKLYGLNALASTESGTHPKPIAEGARLFKGPAYQGPFEEGKTTDADWPTFRHDNQRSGHTDETLPGELPTTWEAEIGGRLTAMTIAGGRVYVGRLDTHSVHALDSRTGKEVWSFTAGGPVDSPPTYWNGRVIFGSADGRVYCLRASDGQLAWRFMAAPSDRRLMAFEQLESVWPVHGSVLVEDGIANFVAGRSAFLDGGLKYFRLNAATGAKMVESIIDDVDPATGTDLQDRLETLQMPVGLNDILSTDGHYVYLRSQKIDPEGKRIDVGPVSGNAAAQGAAQKGEGAHLFAPMGFLDDTWFHRSYWVYGKNFAGGHNGYYQAGKYAPSGRILVFDDKNVYGYGREPKYLKWTTTLEHQLFSAPRVAPDAPSPTAPATGRNRAPAVEGPIVRFTPGDKLDPTGKALTVEIWVLKDGASGVVVAHGGPQNGYALRLLNGRPIWLVRADNELSRVQAESPLGDGWHHLAGVLEKDGTMKLYVNGQVAGTGKSKSLITSIPKQGLELGGDLGSSVGDYQSGSSFVGSLDQFAVFLEALRETDIQRHYLKPDSVKDSKPALFCSMDHADGRDESGNGLHGIVTGIEAAKGRESGAIWLKSARGASKLARGAGAPAARQDSFVQHDWTRFVPVITRAMAMAGDTVFVAGMPDVLDEEYAFERLSENDASIQPMLKEQDDALSGKLGGQMMAVSIKDGESRKGFEMKSPPVWDGMAIARGNLFIACQDGKVRCYGQTR